MAVDGDGDGEGLPSAGPTDEPEVAKLGHPVLHDGRVVAELAAVVVVVAGAHRTQGAVSHILNETR